MVVVSKVKLYANVNTNNKLSAGYRHVDTANMYGNEDQIGKVLRDSKILKRKDVFVTSKFWPDSTSQEEVKQKVQASINHLNGVDLMLVHFPAVCPISVI